MLRDLRLHSGTQNPAVPDHIGLTGVWLETQHDCEPQRRLIFSSSRSNNKIGACLHIPLVVHGLAPDADYLETATLMQILYLVLTTILL